MKSCQVGSHRLIRMSAFGNNLSTFVNKSKKDKRLEAKKKKALALLKLIESKHKESEETTSDGPPLKKACHDQSLELPSGNGESAGIKQTQSSDDDDDSSISHLSFHYDDVPTDAAYAKAKQVLRAQQKWAEYDAMHGTSKGEAKKPMRYGPNFSLTLKNLLPFSKFDEDKDQEKLMSRLPPLFIKDLQHLLLLALLKNLSSWSPRWCRLVRMNKVSSVVLIVVKDVSIADLHDSPDYFPFLTNAFQSCVEMVDPTQYGSTVEQDLCSIPLSISQMKKYTKRQDVRERIFTLISKPEDEASLERTAASSSPCASPKGSSDQEKTSSASGDTEEETKEGEGEGDGTTGGEESDEGSASKEETFPRTSLLMSTFQLMQECYPMPVATNNKLYAGFAFSKEKYLAPTATSPLFAVDCEMCQTSEADYELTRVSIVNEENQVVYDQLVKPHNKITNYLTKFSGMTEELLEPVTKRLEDVQREIRDVLPPDAILCGQSLWNDLNALKLFHPFVIDTAIIFNQSGDRRVKCGLKKLTYNFLGRTIQNSENGHCSIEDAKSVMDLIKLKLQKGIEFGDATLGGVYFPDIKTYFNSPSLAQNVEETFSSQSVPILADSQTPPTSSGAAQSPSSFENAKDDAGKESASTQGGGGACAQTLGSSSREESALSSSICRDSGALSCANSVSVSDRKGMAVIEKSGVNSETGATDGVVRQTHKGGDGKESAMEVCSETDQAVEDNLHGKGDSLQDWRQSEAMSQREVFFQQEGSTMRFSFFEVLADYKNSCGVIGHKDLVEKLQPQDKLEGVATDSDSATCSRAQQVSAQKAFTWLELRAFSQLLRDCPHNAEDHAEKRKHIFFQLDENVRQLVAKLTERTLVAVVMTGRYSEGRHLNAATLVKMTG